MQQITHYEIVKVVKVEEGETTASCLERILADLKNHIPCEIRPIEIDGICHHPITITAPTGKEERT